MKKTATFLILFLPPFFLKAQLITDYKVLGDKAFANKDYYAASVYYQKVTKDEPNGAEAKPFSGHNVHYKRARSYNKADLYFRLAESYRLFQNFINAEPWYYRLLDEPEAKQYPLAKLWYGICLRANQHFDESIKQLQEFQASKNPDKKYNDLAVDEIRNCLFAKEQYRNPKPVKVDKIKGNWNSDGSNYALRKQDSDSYWLTSSRFIPKDSSKKAKVHINRIFYATLNNKGLADLKEIQFTNNNFAEDTEWGTPALAMNGRRMYFTQWYKQGPKTLHAIYCSYNIGKSQWSEPKKLNINVNVDGFNAIQPYITADGKTMYFASNKPGTAGGYDLWSSDLDEQGNPINSINLGLDINTNMDEQAPYYSKKEKKLVYSSKGFTGLGGFDLMESYGTPGNWSKPKNMGYPINSAKDDLYYEPDTTSPGKIYISSDRQSDCCLELYTLISAEAKKITYRISGLVVNCETLKPLAGAKISLSDSAAKQNQKSVTTDSAGRYEFEMPGKKAVKLSVEKDNYFTQSVLAVPAVNNHQDTLTNPLICLKPVKVGKAIVLKNILFDYNKATLRPVSKTDLDSLSALMKDNPKIRIELSAHTDAVGGDNYNLKLSQNRAQSCTDYLIKTGIQPERIIAKGYGETRPVAPNKLPNGKDNPAGRQLNRRTEFMVL